MLHSEAIFGYNVTHHGFSKGIQMTLVLIWDIFMVIDLTHLIGLYVGTVVI